VKITVWGDELAAWIAAVSLAQQGNQVSMLRPDGSELLPSDSSVRNEPGLLSGIQEAIHQGRLKSIPSTELDQDLIHWLAMAPDQLEHALELLQQIPNRSGRLIINQSNFGIGATDRLGQCLSSESTSAIAYIPDTLQQGRALEQFRFPKALIIGCEHTQALIQLKALLRPFSQSVQQIQYMSPREAEFTKFAINGMLALRLGYINELANLADQLGVDIELVRQGMSTDERIGHHYLNPGCGFGGQHFTQYIENLAELLSHKQRSTPLDTVLIENEKQKELPFRKLWQHYACQLHDRTICIWGVAFKPGIASIDNAPSLRVIDALLAQGAHIRLHDPEALPELHAWFGDHPQLTYCDQAYQAAADSEALLLLTEWDEYNSPDFHALLASMQQPVIIDGRNLWEADYLRQLGFTYYGIGR
jgi:UDPglucose 6-dehydrogenase